ncbi:CoB--CoM heterodisulfide reductase [Desulfonatronospira thiodismutans ASO3-1]|uniref:CoB--CoM heterodisulfide reductase n=1 Tax=Desulfonatronospira thiodismutans ASO3-1 TaxID=555779 RepID=D6SQE9_9BACT|nr:CoB--CoM heterodisulfide reductase iron-sulfur subunit B family protein [Desulfonatronospira thiodismutans]EFI34975.1 CoB--CoM heterodisulfide reductase [Desulfonatronospira thiodismutans ASO3-1]
MRNFAYYPGCSGLGTSMEYDKSTRAVCKALGINLMDINDWSCCGSTPAHTVDHLLSSALSGRNLALAEEMEAEAMITPCPSCLSNLKGTVHRLSDRGFRHKVNNLLEKPVQRTMPVKSVLQILDEEVGSRELAERLPEKPLRGLKVATYYGCIMNRPPEVMQFDDHEHPMAMDRLMQALGAEVLPFPLKVECCGASFGIPRKDVVATLSGRLLDTAQALGAHAMVTACPLCQMNLDLRQGQAASVMGKEFNMPVFYYTQLIGVALGLPQKELGLSKLCVKPSIAFDAMRSNREQEPVSKSAGKKKPETKENS